MEQQEKMYSLVDGFHKSGKSLKDFCSETGIKTSTFSYWIKKKRMSEHPKETFLKIEARASFSEGGLEIIYPNGVRLKTSQADLSTISALIRLY